MQDNYDVLVIGGGIVGVSVLYTLAKYNLDIALLEKDAELCFGVSKSNSGIVHTGFQSPYDSVKGPLAVRGNELYHQIAKDLDFPLKQVGELVVAFKGQEETLKNIYENGKKLNIPDMELVDKAWLKKHEPSLSGDIEMALLGNSACVINPYEAVYAMAENAVTNGANIICESKVESIKYSDGLWHVVCGTQEFSAKYVVNAAGLYADEIAKMADINCGEITPRKGEEYLLDRSVKNLTNRIIFPVPSGETKGVLVIPTVDGNYMIGPTAQDLDDKEDINTTPEGKKYVVENVKKLVPEIDVNKVIAAFSGSRPAQKGGDFYIAQDKPGFINLVGIQSPGLTAAPAIAEVVRDMIEKEKTLKEKTDIVNTRSEIPRFRELSDEDKTKLISENPQYGNIICRCELVTEGEIREAIRRGARTLDGIKYRTRSQMGRCHGSFCTMKIMRIMHDELGMDYKEITKHGKGSEIVKGYKHEEL